MLDPGRAVIQLELFRERRCACGAELVSSVNDYRGLCDLCILRKTNSGHVWNNDPDAMRAHLRAWLAARGLNHAHTPAT
jgi:hypothetical protein